jgi:hypothetical protein
MAYEGSTDVFILVLVDASDSKKLSYAQREILRREYPTNGVASQALLMLERLCGVRMQVRAARRDLLTPNRGA